MIVALKQKVDLISSVLVMVVLALGLVFFFIFTAFQVHSETVHLAKLTGNVVSSNPEWLKTALNYTEGQLNDPKIDDYVEQVGSFQQKVMSV